MTTGCYTQVCEEQTPTLMARDYKDAPLVGVEQVGINDHWCEKFKESEVSSTLTSHYSKNTRIIENRYVVRRLTPTECALLQGFPADWCIGLGTAEPTEDDIAFWHEVWETHRLVMGKSTKPKTATSL